MSHKPKSRRPSRRPAAPSLPTTLWVSSNALDRQMLDYTAAEDRLWDGRLIAWDILGSLGHVEGLQASKLLSRTEYLKLRAGLRLALREVEAGRLAVTPEHEDVHTCVEDWLVRRTGTAGERLHTGRSRNDQVACDLRLYLKDRLLLLSGDALDLAESLLGFATQLSAGAVARVHPYPAGHALVGRAVGRGVRRRHPRRGRGTPRRLGQGGPFAAR